MAEAYPNPHPESGPHENKKGSGKAEKNAPDSIRKVGSDRPLKFGDEILRARPLDSELFKPAAQHESGPAETHRQPEVTEHQRGEREDWHGVSAQELHERAVADQQARLEDLHRQEHAANGDRESDDDEAESKKTKKYIAEARETDKPKPASESEQPESVEDILLPQDSEVPNRRTDEIPAEAAPHLGPEAEQNPEQPAETEADFQDIVRDRALADLAAIEIPDLSDHTTTPEEQPASDDEVFRDMIAHETGEDPGEANVHEQQPGLPPIEAGNSEPISFDQWLQAHPELNPLARTTNTAANSAPGHNGLPHSPGAGGPHGFNPNTPNQPPFGGGNGNQPPGGPPNPNAGAWNNGPNVPNPNALNNPWAPAGNILNPAVLAGMTALEARRRLDSLRHTAREAGLAGAVGILGLGLVIEHFRINKTRRMLKKQGKEHTKALSKTNRALQQEQYAHQATQAKLERLGTAHHATDEQLRRKTAMLNTTEHARTGPVAAAEMIAGAGFTGAAELAAHAGRKHGLSRNEQLARQLEQDKQLGQAIKRNPELRDIAGLASSAAAERSEFNREVREAAGADVAANVLTEKRYEQLQTRSARNGGGAQSGGADSASLPSLPMPQQAAALSTLAAAGAQQAGKKADRTNIATNPLAWATVLVIIAIIAVVVIIG